jgi:cell division septal protein FtsQ
VDDDAELPGRALERSAPRRRSGRLGRLARVLGLALLLMLLAHVPWAELRARVSTVDDIRVEGLHYLDAPTVLALAGITRGMDAMALDRDRARQALLADSRIQQAAVERRWPHAIVVRIEERQPVLLVRHGEPWEMDSTGVLLAPLKDGVVADVPLLSGPTFEPYGAGTRIATPGVARGLAWTRATSVAELELAGQISEIDVSDPRVTALLLMNGTRVACPAWPPDTRRLSSLRVVLADLKRRGAMAQEVDLRFDNQVIVRPAETAKPSPVTPARPS